VNGVTLDSNVYVSALQFRGSGFLTMGRAGLIRIDTSEAILEETLGVLRDKFGWGGYQIQHAREELLKFVNLVAPKHALAVADDPDDNRILECALEAGSDYIVTWDKGLLRLGEYAGVRIVAPAEFVARRPER